MGDGGAEETGGETEVTHKAGETVEEVVRPGSRGQNHSGEPGPGAGAVIRLLRPGRRHICC